MKIVCTCPKCKVGRDCVDMSHPSKDHYMLRCSSCGHVFTVKVKR